MLKIAPKIRLFGTGIAVLLSAAGCVEPKCPRGYDQKGDTCYRRKDAGPDGATMEIGDDDTPLEDASFPALEPDAERAEMDGGIDPDAEAADPLCGDGSADTCVQCNSAADCRNPIDACQERVCSPTGSCGVRTKTSDTCPTGGGCDDPDQCAECIDSSTCPASLPYCTDGKCRECTDDDNCGSARLECKNHMCINRCGNGLIERTAGEDCEVGASGWTTTNCLMCKEIVYGPRGPANCQPTAADMAAANFFGPGNCPSIPGFTPTCLYIGGLGCNLSCNSDANCPARYRCSSFTGTVFEGWNPPFAGYCR